MPTWKHKQSTSLGEMRTSACKITDYVNLFKLKKRIAYYGETRANE